MNNYYNEIKHELLNYEVTKKVKEYSIKLTKELGKGYSERSLKDMRKFYLFIQKRHAMHAEFDLSWNHYKKLFVLIEDGAIKYYIELSKKYNLSYRELGNRIKSKEYERLSEETKSKLSLDKIQEYQIADFVKNPIVIKYDKKYLTLYCFVM